MTDEPDLSKPHCTWAGCQVQAKCDILVTRGRDGTHYITGPFCHSHGDHTLGSYPHTMPGTDEILYAEMLPLGEGVNT